MAYTLVYSGGNITVVDGTLNTTATSLALPGRNYSGYGSPVDQNFVSTLENFASANASGPTNPIKGQFWFDSSNATMKFNTSSNSTPAWSAVAVNSSNANLAANNVTCNSLTANSAAIGNLTLSGYLMHSVSSAVAAAGTVQSDATALTKTINLVVSGTTNQGVRLPGAMAGMVIYVTNVTGTTIKVYPATGAAINNLAVNTAISVGTAATVHFIAPTTSQWYSTGATYA